MKKSLLVALVMIMAFAGLSANGQQDTETSTTNETIVLRYGEVNPNDHPVTLGANKFADLAAEKSGGRIKITVYPSSQLGDQSTMIQGTQMGAIDMVRLNPSFLVDMGLKDMQVFGLPYLFNDLGHARKAMDSDFGTDFLGKIDTAKLKMIGLGYFLETPRNYFFSEKAVTSVADMKGLKVRVPQSEIFMDTARAFGASPTPIAYSELYTALQTGVVDGAENPIAGYYANKFYEVGGNYTFDGHDLAPSIVVFSEITWSKLSDKDHAILREAFKEAQAWYREYLDGETEKAIQHMRDRGINFYEVDDISEWQDAVAPLYKKYGAGFENYVDEIRAIN
jgi:TRAP-type transport system periplasmic protein